MKGLNSTTLLQLLFERLHSLNCWFIYFDSEAVVSQVLDELGLQLTDQLTGLPIATGTLAASGVSTKGGAQAAAAGAVDADADLQARLMNLRRE